MFVCVFVCVLLSHKCKFRWLMTLQKNENVLCIVVLKFVSFYHWICNTYMEVELFVCSSLYAVH